MDFVSGLFESVTDSFMQTSLYEGFFADLPGVFSDPVVDMLLMGAAAVLLLILIIIIILLASSGKKKNRRKPATRAKQVHRKDLPEKTETSSEKPADVLVPESAHMTTGLLYDEEIDIDELLSEKVMEQQRYAESRTEPAENEFQKILLSIRNRKLEQARLRQQIEEEEKKQELNMAALQNEVTSKYRVEGKERDSTGEEIRRMQEADKQARVKEFEERKRKRRR